MVLPQKRQRLKSIALIMCFSLFLALPQACSAQGEQYSCEVEFEEMCITKVTWNIPEKYAKEGKHFTVSYVTTDGKTEKAVALHNVGHYMCDAVGDHVCADNSPSTSATISSLTACVTGRLYVLAADGEKGFPCTPTQNGRKPFVKSEDSIEDSDAPCTTDTPVISDEAISRDEKRTAGVKCKQKSEQEEAFQSEVADGVVIGIVCGVVALIVLLVAGIAYYFIKKRGKEKRFICGYDAVSTNI